VKYKVWYNEEVDALYIQTFERLTKDDVGGIMDRVNAELEGRQRRYVVVDLSEGSSDMVDREARKAFKGIANPYDFEKLAVFGANPSVRMLAKVVLAITGVSSKTRFFKTEAQAIRWLKGDAKR
jgi:hypothetical protein